ASIDGNARVLSLTLPAASPKVLLLGYVGKVPPLPLRDDRTALAAARRQWESGDAEGAVNTLRGHQSGEVSADALLLAIAAERSHDPEFARDVLAVVGSATRTGAALAHASTLTADLAVEHNSLELTADAYVLAQTAVEAGDPALSAFARLSR